MNRKFFLILICILTISVLAAGYFSAYAMPLGQTEAAEETAAEAKDTAEETVTEMEEAAEEAVTEAEGAAEETVTEAEEAEEAAAEEAGDEIAGTGEKPAEWGTVVSG